MPRGYTYYLGQVCTGEPSDAGKADPHIQAQRVQLGANPDPFANGFAKALDTCIPVSKQPIRAPAR